MSFSFIEIEEEKSRIIAFVFTFIVLIYFLTAYLILIIIENSFHFTTSLAATREGLFFPPATHTLVALAAAFFIGIFHWKVSTGCLIEKMIAAVGAKPIDEKDSYHQYLKNIVSEVSVATGGKPIEIVVIPTAAMNAFSLQDFKRRSVIGVTEGLLSRMNRPQIESVIGHEAAHIVSGDALTTTVISSISEVYEEAAVRIRQSLKKVRGQAGIILLFIFLLLLIINFLSKLLRFFLSRQREYRADAVAIRLTRNPLSLAEALKMISGHWRGSGSDGAKVESIFIMNPHYSRLDEEEGFIANLFSTHPPARRRVDILLGMAHLDEKTLEQNLKNFQHVSPVAKAEFKTEVEVLRGKKWSVFKEGNWLGPFLLEDLKKIEGVRPDNWVKIEGEDNVIPAYEDSQLKAGLFGQSVEKEDDLCCPHCKITLDEIIYEGAPILKCSSCNGIFVDDYGKVTRVLIREDMRFSDEMKKIGEAIIKDQDKIMLQKKDLKTVWAINCPKCKQLMGRQFFNYVYPIEIDRCIFCKGIWFDKQELELLQYLYENNEEIVGDKNF